MKFSLCYLNQSVAGNLMRQRDSQIRYALRILLNLSEWVKKTLGDFRLPPRCESYLRSLGMLRKHGLVVSYRLFGTTYLFHPLKSISTRRRKSLLVMMAIRLNNTYITFVVKRFCYRHNLKQIPVIQKRPLATEPGISLIILPLMRILKRNLKRITDTFLFISHTTNVLLFKFRCNIFIGVSIIKEMPGSVASGTPCILTY